MEREVNIKGTIREGHIVSEALGPTRVQLIVEFTVRPGDSSPMDWLRQAPTDVWLSTTEPVPLKIERVEEYLTRHPAPWKISDIGSDHSGDYQAVVDRYGREIFSSADAEGYHAFFTGNIEDMVEMVNTIAETLEVEGEPEPARIDPDKAGHWVEFTNPCGDIERGILTKIGDGWNEDGRQDCWVIVPGDTLSRKVEADKLALLEHEAPAWEPQSQDDGGPLRFSTRNSEKVLRSLGYVPPGEDHGQ